MISVKRPLVQSRNFGMFMQSSCSYKKFLLTQSMQCWNNCWNTSLKSMVSSLRLLKIINLMLLAVSSILNLYWLVLKQRNVVVSLIGEKLRQSLDISTAVPIVFIILSCLFRKSQSYTVFGSSLRLRQQRSLLKLLKIMNSQMGISSIKLELFCSLGYVGCIIKLLQFSRNRSAMLGRKESTDVYSRTAPDNTGCGSGFFRVLSPRTNERSSLIEQENSDGKHSIHMIMRKKSPFQKTDESFNREMKSPGKEPLGIKTHHHLIVQELKKKVSVLQGHLVQMNNHKHLLENQKFQLNDAIHHLKALHEQQKRHLQNLRQSHQATIQESNNLRLENQMLKSKLQDRTAKLQECLTILKTKYNHFQKQQQQIDLKQQQKQQLTTNVKKLQAQLVRLKQQLISVYDENEQLKSNKPKPTSTNKISSVNKMYPVLTPKQQLLVDWKYNLETLYKKQISDLQSELSQLKGQSCIKCQEMRCLIITMNEKKEMDYGDMADSMVKKASLDMFNKFCQAEQVAI